MSYDALVVGGGLVGSSTALALADAGHKIAIVDAKPAITELKENLDLRVVALSTASLAWLKHIAVFEQLDRQRIGCFRQISACEKDVNKLLDFSAEKMQLDYLGIIAENQHVLYCMHQRILQHHNIDSYFEHKLKSINEFEAQLTIGADGGNSWLRQQLGITVQQKDYQQRALVCYVQTEKSHNNIAWQRFLDTGPLAFLPMHAPNLYSIVWTLPQDATLLQASADELTTALQTATAGHFGAVQLAAKPASFPLRMQHAQSYGAQSCILLGDAIHTIHPLAGQGVNLGFTDAADLFKLLNKTAVKHWGHELTCQKFERQRRLQNTLMAQGMSLFLKPRLRHVGMQLFKHSQLLKKMAMQVALG
jgi:ubiquinone biosynthesis UbiH/UbiF/VisC/COQ6 family hydroxylase